MGAKDNQQNQDVLIPPAVNWHCQASCNYGCKFCYARFSEQQLMPRLSAEDGCLILESLSANGVSKVNFVGGEPMLQSHLETWIIEAKRLGMTTSIVSNGTKMSNAWLEEMAPHLDWLGLSIDASTDALHAAMGRGRRGEIKRGKSHHLARCHEIIRLAKDLGYGIKLNTVVSSVNAFDNMAHLVREWHPSRWKIFQVLPIEGENDGEIGTLEVSEEQFQAYVVRHQNALSDMNEIEIIGEDNDAMRGTYAMIDPLGLVYTNAGGKYLYSSQPVHAVGFEAAWSQVAQGWSEEDFEHRQGIWNWADDNATVRNPVLQSLSSVSNDEADGGAEA